MSANKKVQPELRISIALSAAFFVQTAFVLIWAGAAAERINQLEKKANSIQELIVHTALLEEQISYIRATVQRIDRKIDDVNEEAAR